MSVVGILVSHFVSALVVQPRAVLGEVLHVLKFNVSDTSLCRYM